MMKPAPIAPMRNSRQRIGGSGTKAIASDMSLSSPKRVASAEFVGRFFDAPRVTPRAVVAFD